MTKRIFRAICLVAAPVLLTLTALGAILFGAVTASLPEEVRQIPMQILMRALPFILIALALLTALVWVGAQRLASKIVDPLRQLNLDVPRANHTYPELEPLLEHIGNQQRKLKEQSVELQRKKTEFETATNHMTEGLVLLGEGGIILAINRSAVKLLSINTYCIGQKLDIICPDGNLQDLVKRAQGGEHTEMMIAISGSNYQINASPTVSDGKVAGVTLLIFDISEKEKAEKLRQEFTANVSHELKTPLHSISGYAELLAGGMVKEDDIPKFAGQIYSEARRMIVLVEDIIKLSRLDEGASDAQRETVDLYALANETVNSLSLPAEAAGIHLTLSGTPAPLFGIRQFLSLIIFNLCDNAIKYNRPDGNVRINVTNTAEYAVLTVSDTGIGIPPEEQERIFERFYRVDKSHSKSLGGTGLGLSIVKHAAKLHDARIKLHSIPDVGTTVTVYFPK